MNKSKSKIDRVNLQQVIRVEHVVGAGTVDSPVKKVVQFWTTRGILIGEKDINDLYEHESAVLKNEY